MARSLRTIALEIEHDYASRGKDLPAAAAAYVRPMYSLDTMDDQYFNDDAETVVIYGLSNLNGWRGETATRVKRELKVMLHTHNPRLYKMPK